MAIESYGAWSAATIRNPKSREPPKGRPRKERKQVDERRLDQGMNEDESVGIRDYGHKSFEISCELDQLTVMRRNCFRENEGMAWLLLGLLKKCG